MIGGVAIADLNGIIPALPSGGSYSQRQQYGPNGSQNQNYYESEFGQAQADALNQANALAGGGNKAYKAGGYIYGYGDPNNPGNASTNFSRDLTPFVAGGKIIPSQYTMTAAQSVGPAQFAVNGGGFMTQGQPTQDNFTQGPALSSSTQAQAAAKPNGFYFGNNGSAGFVGGGLGASQGDPFYQQEPSSINQSQQGLGTFSALTPQQQALIQSR